MAHFRKMEVINVTALPMVPVDEALAVSLAAQNARKSAMERGLEDSPPCILLGCHLQLWLESVTCVTSLFLTRLSKPYQSSKRIRDLKDCLTKIIRKSPQRESYWKYLLKE